MLLCSAEARVLRGARKFSTQSSFAGIGSEEFRIGQRGIRVVIGSHVSR